jgi:hypothetical protein
MGNGFAMNRLAYAMQRKLDCSPARLACEDFVVALRLCCSVSVVVLLFRLMRVIQPRSQAQMKPKQNHRYAQKVRFLFSDGHGVKQDAKQAFAMYLRSGGEGKYPLGMLNAGRVNFYY